MGLDWTALEQGIHRVALQKAATIMTEHPGHTFYGLALHGVPTEEGAALVLPVLALNSTQAEARDLADDADEDPGAEEDEWVEEVEGGDYTPPPLDGSDPPESADDEDVDADDDVAVPEDELAEDDSVGFYSRHWDPTEWHWDAVELVEDAAAGVWERAFAAEARATGWAETAERYDELLIRVVKELRQEVLASRGVDLVCFVADDDHAERLLRACLTQSQLREYFPELVQAPRELTPRGAEEGDGAVIGAGV